MQMPALGSTVVVVATTDNVETAPCTGRFFTPWTRTSIVVTEFIARRLVDGALYLAPAETATPAPKGE